MDIGLESGSLTALEGPSGSGKTTLLRQLVGLEEAAGARRLLSGRDYPEGELAEWRSRVTLLAQDGPMIPGTVGDNLEMIFRSRVGRGRVNDHARRRHLLDGVGLGDLDPERHVGTLSGGERHRLALVRGLLWDPPVLIADEPLVGMDPDNADFCFALLAEHARRRDRCVLVVLHDPQRSKAADRRLAIVPGTAEER
jgi:putative ABC transport system ATP-binding protein